MGVQEGRARATLFGVRKLGQEALGSKRKKGNPEGGICTRASTVTDVAGLGSFLKVSIDALSLIVFLVTSRA